MTFFHYKIDPLDPTNDGGKWYEIPFPDPGWDPQIPPTPDPESPDGEVVCLTPGDTMTRVESVKPAGDYRVYLRYRAEEVSTDALLTLVQSSTGTQLVTIPTVTPSGTFDGTWTYDGLDGYYNLGVVTFARATLTITIDGPGTGHMCFDRLVFSRDQLPSIGPWENPEDVMQIGTTNEVQ